MKCYRGIGITDGINRLNHMIPPTTLLNSYMESWNIEIPCSLNHDHTKFIGWNRLGGIYVEPGKMYQMIQMGRVDSKEEEKEISKKCNEYLYKVRYEEKREQYDILSKKLDAFIENDYEPGLVNAVAVINSGIVLRVFPELMDEIKKKGLLDLNLFDPVLPGVYKRGEYLLFAHPYLRRSLSRLNTLVEPLLEKLEALRLSDINVEIALDMDMIGLAGTEEKEVEYQYWWGPHFSEQLDENELGITRHENETWEIEYSNVSFTEFGWHMQDGKKTFEAEEIVGSPNIGVGGEDEKYGCRYIHSILNPSTGLPCHLDGAVRAYTLEKYVNRTEITLDKAERDTEYTKLWRIDNDIHVKLWKELVADYYRDNMLVGEYLGGIDTIMDQFVSEEKEQGEVKLIDHFVPLNMKQGMGIRLYFQYMQDSSKEIGGKDVEIFSPYKVNLQNGYFFEIEADTITLIKEIRNEGIIISTNGYIEVARDDLIYNFPTFICKEKKVAEKIQNAMARLINIWLANEDDRLVSYSLEYPLDQKWVKICFAGHIKDIQEYLEFTEHKLPCERNINPWICSLYEYMSKTYPHIKQPKQLSLLTNYGDLRFDRKLVSVEEFSETDGKPIISIPSSIDDFKKALEEHLVLAKYRAILDTQCVECGDNYRNCKCNKYLGKGEVIKKSIELGYFWTNRSCYEGVTMSLPNDCVTIED